MTGKLLQALQKLGAVRGLRGNSRAWTVVWVAAFAARQVRKRRGRKGEEVVFRQELGPGEALVIDHTHTTFGEV